MTDIHTDVAVIVGEGIIGDNRANRDTFFGEIGGKSSIRAEAGTLIVFIISKRD